MKNVTFNSQSCITAAEELIVSKNKLDTILNTELNDLMQTARVNYKSDSAEQIYAAYGKIATKFPEFIQAVNECSKYLRETVAPAYENLERKVSESVQ